MIKFPGRRCHVLRWYFGFGGVPGYFYCARCGQPWKDLGIPLDPGGDCPGKKYAREMREKTEALWRRRVRD